MSKVRDIRSKSAKKLTDNADNEDGDFTLNSRKAMKTNANNKIEITHAIGKQQPSKAETLQRMLELAKNSDNDFLKGKVKDLEQQLFQALEESLLTTANNDTTPVVRKNYQVTSASSTSTSSMLGNT